MFLDFVHLLLFLKTRFGNWICFILAEDGNRSSFRNVAFLETLHDEQSPKT
jgi:hypothetical protein